MSSCGTGVGSSSAATVTASYRASGCTLLMATQRNPGGNDGSGTLRGSSAINGPLRRRDQPRAIAHRSPSSLKRKNDVALVAPTSRRCSSSLAPTASPIPRRRAATSTVTNAQAAPSVVVSVFSPATPIATTAPSTSATNSTIRARSGRVARKCTSPARETTRESSAACSSDATASRSPSSAGTDREPRCHAAKLSHPAAVEFDRWFERGLSGRAAR